MGDREGGRWDCVNGLRPLALALVFVLVIALELVEGVDGLSAGARAALGAALVGVSWEIVPRAVARLRRQLSPTG
ncbi:MAG TPA: hypothetical protein VFM41_10130 [Gaiella sp.]|jgi:hypothetical protein|nr:hypothetical protein [Gaiella sp.]